MSDESGTKRAHLDDDAAAAAKAPRTDDGCFSSSLCTDLNTCGLCLESTKNPVQFNCCQGSLCMTCADGLVSAKIVGGKCPSSVKCIKCMGTTSTVTFLSKANPTTQLFDSKLTAAELSAANTERTAFVNAFNSSAKGGKGPARGAPKAYMPMTIMTFHTTYDMALNTDRIGRNVRLNALKERVMFTLSMLKKTRVAHEARFRGFKAEFADILGTIATASTESNKSGWSDTPASAAALASLSEYVETQCMAAAGFKMVVPTDMPATVRFVPAAPTGGLAPATVRFVPGVPTAGSFNPAAPTPQSILRVIERCVGTVNATVEAQRSETEATPQAERDAKKRIIARARAALKEAHEQFDTEVAKISLESERSTLKAKAAQLTATLLADEPAVSAETAARSAANKYIDAKFEFVRSGSLSQSTRGRLVDAVRAAKAAYRAALAKVESPERRQSISTSVDDRRRNLEICPAATPSVQDESGVGRHRIPTWKLNTMPVCDTCGLHRCTCAGAAAAASSSPPRCDNCRQSSDNCDCIDLEVESDDHTPVNTDDEE